MIRLPGGSFLMGSGKFYPEERPVREAAVGPFWIDESPVTNGQFRDFVAGTGYMTAAERPVTAADYPDADPSLLTPGSLVFHRASGPVSLRDVRNWWSYVPGADWRAWTPQRRTSGSGASCGSRRSRRIGSSLPGRSVIFPTGAGTRRPINSSR
jgi:formylglycine-generating enzyme